MNVINYVTQDSIQIIKIVSEEKELVDKFVEKCSENIDEKEMINNVTLNDYENVCGSSTIYSTICHCFFNNHRRYQCIYLYSLVLKKIFFETILK